MEERIPVGTRVEVVGGFYEGKKGTLIEDDRTPLAYLVKFDDGDTSWVYAHEIKPLAEQAAPKFKVGDKVEIDWEKTTYISDLYSDTGVVKALSKSGFGTGHYSGGIFVSGFGGTLTFLPEHLTLITEATPAERKPKAGEIWRDADEGLVVMTGMFDEDGDPECFSLEGEEVAVCGSIYLHNLTFVADSLSALLAQNKAEVKEEKRVPKEGEIWRLRDGELCLVTDERRNGNGELTVVRLGCHLGMLTWCNESLETFVYPNLAAAIEAGETFK